VVDDNIFVWENIVMTTMSYYSH